MAMNNWGGIKEHMTKKPKKAFKNFYRKETHRKGRLNPDVNFEMSPNYVPQEGNYFFDKTAGIVAVTVLITFLYLIVFRGVGDVLKSDTKQEEERIEAILAQDKYEKKQAQLEQNYLELMRTGEDYFQKAEYQLAITDFKKAKLIFPERLAPRLKIIIVANQICEITGKSCRLAQDELSAGFEHIKKHPHKDNELYLKEFRKLADEWRNLVRFKKRKQLKNYYLELLEKGDKYLQDSEYILAIENYKKAKHLFPKMLEPRLKLITTANIHCEINRKGCRLAKNEMLRAAEHIKKYPHKDNELYRKELRKQVNKWRATMEKLKK